MIDRTYHSGEKVEETYIASYERQYLYKEREQYVFMDTKTFEQHFINEEQLGDNKYFLKEGTVVTMQMMDDKPIDIIMPITVELEVVGSEVGGQPPIPKKDYEMPLPKKTTFAR